MAIVRCPCGKQYKIPDKHVGKRLKCAACDSMFVARAAAEPKPAVTVRAGGIGELALASGFLTREQLDGCLEYQEAVHAVPPPGDDRLADILLRHKLLTKARCKALLNHAGGARPVARRPTHDPREFRRDHPLSAEKREAMRQSVEAAARGKAKLVRDIQEAVDRKPSLLSRLTGLHYAAAALIVAGAIILLALWPAPGPERTLVAYLRSADEASVAPDASLTTSDLGIVVRSFGDVTLLPATRYDYGPELDAFRAGEDGEQWSDFLAAAKLPADKQRVLELLVPAIPARVKPRLLAGLRITAQPATCALTFKRRGTGYYTQGIYRFLMLKATSPDWRSDWKLAHYERLGEDGPG